MKTIKIVGGGVAGLALGIGLRKADVPVDLYEAGNYPRHRVCGEFISGAGQDVIERLGLALAMDRSGATFARTGILFLGKAHSPARNLPRPALCISRYHLDKTLVDVFENLGGNLYCGTRLQESGNGSGVVWASGRRPHVKENGWRWFGLKAHATGLRLEADLEVHSALNGYIGLCRLSDGVVNVCGLFRKRAGESDREQGPTGMSTLRGAPGSMLHDRLAGAHFEENSFCAVAGLGWKPEVRPQFCSIGDAFAMTPPVTGNGMSIAFETAALATGPLIAYSRGELEWPGALNSIRRKCREALSSRLRWASWLHHAMMSRYLQGSLGSLLLGSDALWPLFFEATRSSGKIQVGDAHIGIAR